MFFPIVLALAFAPSVQANTAPNAEAPNKPAKEHKVCRSMMVTGSIMAKHECHTEAEWKAIDAQNASNVEQMNRQRSNGG